MSRLSDVLRAGLAVEAPKRERVEADDPMFAQWNTPDAKRRALEADERRERAGLNNGQYASPEDPGYEPVPRPEQNWDPVWPFRDIDLEEERRRPYGPRLEMWRGDLLTYFRRKMMQQNETLPDNKKRSMDDIWRRASRKTRETLHKKFPDEPPSSQSDSDEDMNADKKQQDAALLAAQAARRAAAQQ